MNHFHYSIPTQIYFGKGQISHLEELKQFGSRVLLVYGGGSIHASGLYDTVMDILRRSGMEVTELSGVEPNPRIQSVRQGVQLCREHHVDVVLAVGGGSVIDCAKVVAAGALYDGDAWDLVLDGGRIRQALPIVSVLTLAATGSEMDHFAVISDMEANDKVGTGSELLKPRFSILDPQYTYSVSRRQTAAGTADIMSHILENYFTPEQGGYVQARFCEGLLRTCIHYLPVAMEHPDNYEARANLIWTSSLAINGLLSYGVEVDWCVHPMEHELSAFYDITHGEGLALLTPFWMEHVLSDATVDKFVEYGVEVWGLKNTGDRYEVAREAIACTRKFFADMGLPGTLKDVGIGEEHLEIMAQKASRRTAHAYVPLSAEDILKIFRAAL